MSEVGRIGSAIVPEPMEALQLSNVHFHSFVDAQGQEPGAGVYFVNRKSDRSEVLHRVIDLIKGQSLV
jgi:hypothetical protein